MNQLGKTNKFFKLGLENVTNTALVLGQITTLPIALMGTAIMMFIDKRRDIKITFKGLFMDTIFWMLFAIISSNIESNFMMLSIMLIIDRFTFFRVMQIVNQGSFEDLLDKGNNKEYVKMMLNLVIDQVRSYGYKNTKR